MNFIFIKKYIYKIWMLIIYFLVLILILIELNNQCEKRIIDFFPFNSEVFIIPYDSFNMQPSLIGGNICLIKKISLREFHNLKIGDIIFFKAYDEVSNDEINCIHRIVDKNTKEEYVTTKGDNNSEIFDFEKKIPYQNIDGKIIYLINPFVLLFFILLLSFFLFHQKEKLIELKEKKDQKIYYQFLIFLNNILQFILLFNYFLLFRNAISHIQK
ncbi:hypothetical protein [Candidatus Phytoplasma sacchari]